MRYIALKFDMVKSRRLKRRSEVQEQFLRVSNSINNEFSEGLCAHFVVTHGDEAQALLETSSAASVLRIYEFLVLSLESVSFRCGVGLGTLNTPLQELAIGMDGEAWQNAKMAIDEAKGKRLSIMFKGFEPEIQPHLDALGNLLCHLQSRWTKEQKETIRLALKTKTQTEIASVLGISDAAVSKRLAAAGWRHYLAGRQTLEFLLNQAIP